MIGGSIGAFWMGSFFPYGFDERAWYSEIHVVTQSVYGA
jgi:hypothetical protein